MTTAPAATTIRNGDDLSDWLRQAFAAERAPVRATLPAPRVTQVAAPALSAPPAVRGSFVLMLVLSASALLLHL